MNPNAETHSCVAGNRTIYSSSPLQENGKVLFCKREPERYVCPAILSQQNLCLRIWLILSQITQLRALQSLGPSDLTTMKPPSPSCVWAAGSAGTSGHINPFIHHSGHERGHCVLALEGVPWWVGGFIFGASALYQSEITQSSGTRGMNMPVIQIK